jgi:GDP-4-dehydro-6-deoxy-D-mannose reductase
MISRAVVTGASGFLGRHLVAQLEGAGAEVWKLRSRFGAPTTASQISCTPGDLSDYLTRARPDVVFHVAGVSQADCSSEYYQVNVVYAATLLDALTMAKLQDTTLALVGTAAEYGALEIDDLPAQEDGKTRPAGYYGESKLAQTRLAELAMRENRRVMVFRPSNIIGPGMSPNLAIGAFVTQLAAIARKQREAVLYVGDLSTARDLIDVQDVSLLMLRLAEIPTATGKVINIATGRPTRMEEVLRSLLDMFLTAGFGPVRVESRAQASTGASSQIHYSSTRRLVELVGEIRYTPLAESLSRILSAELAHV